MTAPMAAASGTKPAGRLHYLDNLKVFALLLGLLVHADDFLSEAAQFDVIKTLSTNFRMATFFLVAGFFGALVMTRRGAAEFYKRRFLALGVPLCFGVLLLNPLTISLKSDYRAIFLREQAVDIGSPGLPALLHLWFLVCLLAYVALTPPIIALIRSDRAMRLFAPLGAPGREGAKCFALTLLVVGWCLAVRLVASRVGLEHLGRSVLYYLPFFVLGCVLFLRAGMSNVLVRIDPAAIAFAGAMAIAGQVLPESALQKACYYGAQAAFQCCISFALLWLFRRFADFSTAWSRMLSRSVYTLYLLHYLLLTLVSAFWITFWPSSPLQGIVAATFAALVGVFIHERVVERSRLYGLLLNGNPLGPPRARNTGGIVAPAAQLADPVSH